jgi:hypothetical protein
VNPESTPKSRFERKKEKSSGKLSKTITHDFNQKIIFDNFCYKILQPIFSICSSAKNQADYNTENYKKKKKKKKKKEITLLLAGTIDGLAHTFYSQSYNH